MFGRKRIAAFIDHPLNLFFDYFGPDRSREVDEINSERGSNLIDSFNVSVSPLLLRGEMRDASLEEISRKFDKTMYSA
jgi:hypothetical protein